MPPLPPPPPSTGEDLYDTLLRDSSVAQVSEEDPGLFTGNVPELWLVFSAANGGFVVATMLQAMRAFLAAKQEAKQDAKAAKLPTNLLSVTSHYLAKTDPGSHHVRVTLVNTSRSLVHLQAELVQAGIKRAFCTALFGRINPNVTNPRLTFLTSARALPPTRTQQQAHPAKWPAIPNRPEFMDLLKQIGYYPIQEKGRSGFELWCNFSQTATASDIVCAFLIDAFHPALFHHTNASSDGGDNSGAITPGTVWCPTLDLTTHVFCFPAPGPLFIRSYVPASYNGFLEQSVELWDSQSRLVAFGHQSMLAVPIERNLRAVATNPTAAHAQLTTCVSRL